MKQKHNHTLIINWVFIVGLLVLIINDHYLKWTYHNWLTGKLSDFAGLLIFPMFLQYSFPKLKIPTILTGLLFVFWKLPLSESFINLYNKITFVPVERTVDYTDFVALVVLPFSHFLMQSIECYSLKRAWRFSLNPAFLMVPCLLVFMADQPPLSYRYSQPGGDVHIGKEYKLKLNKNDILEKLKSEGFLVKPDTALNREFSNNAYYIIENAVFEKDTIPRIAFALYGSDKRTLLLINDVTLKGDMKFTDWRSLKRFSKMYRKVIKENLIEEIK